MASAKIYCLLAVLLIALLPKTAYSSSSILQTGEENLDSDSYILKWNITSDEIHFEVIVQTTGYVGLGISPNGGMTGADIFIAGVFANGSIYGSDRHATGHSVPVLDNHSDWVLDDASENGTYTTVKFHRLLNTCDETEDYPITDETMRVIWAVGDTDDIVKHFKRGTQSINFFLQDNIEFDPTRFDKLDIMTNSTIPAQHTSYLCSIHEGSTLAETRHIVAFEPVLDNALALEHTHHFVLTKCVAPEGLDPEDVFGPFVGQEGRHCYEKFSDDEFPIAYCIRNYIYVWSKGGKRMVFPEQIGYPMPGRVNKKEYYAMEVHYDNPSELNGLSFETGGRVYYTKAGELRPEEAGLVIVNHDIGPQLTVPPVSENFIVAGHCSSECTEYFLPNEGITLFNNLFHSHLTGRQMKLRHFRGREELPWVDVDDHYDFNYQQNKPLLNPVKIQKGDQLTVECTYDNSDDPERKAVIGGLSSSEEMCEAIMYFYPSIPHWFCGSVQTVESHFELLGVTNFTEKNSSLAGGFPTYEIVQPESLAGDYLDSVSSKFDWTPDFRRDFQEQKRFGFQDGMCCSEGADGSIVCRNGAVKYPENLVEYVPIDECSRETPTSTSATSTSADPSTSTSTPPISQTGEEQLDSDNYILKWNITSDQIYFEVIVRTTGYVGLGISPNGGMTGADIFIAGVFDENGAIYGYDRHATGHSVPITDQESNWSLDHGSQNGTHTTLRFHRLLVTCDETEDIRITEETMRVIWAVGDTDEIVKHSKRGTKSINFFLQDDHVFDPTRYEKLEIITNLTMPAQQTTYFCTIHEGPTLAEKRHIVAFEPVLENALALEYTHHFVLYKCVAPEGRDPEQFFGPFVGKGEHCYEERSDSSEFPIAYCTSTAIYAWSKGGKKLVFPPEIGLAIPAKLDRREYYAMEVHYDNPQSLPNLQFNTGGRIYYTNGDPEELRDNDAGIVVFNHDIGPQLTVPPVSENFVVAAHCSKECTEYSLSTEGITLFNNLFHSHLTGRRMKLRHFRGRQELPWVDSDDHYDFDYQQNKPLSTWRKVERSDQLTVECTYDTSGDPERKAVTGGLSSKEEMCEAIMYYYPGIPEWYCGSKQNIDRHFELFGISNYTKKNSPIDGDFPKYDIIEPVSLAGDYLDSVSFKVDWTNDFRKQYQQEKRFGSQEGTCCIGGGGGTSCHSGAVKYPDNFVEYAPINECTGSTFPPTTTPPPPGGGNPEGGSDFLRANNKGIVFSCVTLYILLNH